MPSHSGSELGPGMSHKSEVASGTIALTKTLPLSCASGVTRVLSVTVVCGAEAAVRHRLASAAAAARAVGTASER